MTRYLLIMFLILSVLLVACENAKEFNELNNEPEAEVLENTQEIEDTLPREETATPKRTKECVDAPTHSKDPCTTYRCMVNGITDGACYETKEDCVYACNDEEKCKSADDCDDGDPNTINYCVGRDKLARCEFYPKPDCVKIYGTGAERNIKFSIVLQGFSDKTQSQKTELAYPHIERIVKTDPFKSYKDRIDFYLLDTDIDFRSSGSLDESPIKDYSKQACGATETLVLFGDDSELLRDGGGGNHLAFSKISDTWILLHELGHSFANLGDNYEGWILYDGKPTQLKTKYPNVDVAGCPKWCESYKPAYSNHCTEISSEQECRQKGRKYDSMREVWSCANSENCCVWLPEKNEYFDSFCVEVRGHTNIGVACEVDSGCYFGSNGQVDILTGQGVWRPYDKKGVMTGYRGEANTFNSIEKKAIENVFSCCYPSSCDDFDKVKCSKLASNYDSFSHCGECN